LPRGISTGTSSHAPTDMTSNSTNGVDDSAGVASPVASDKYAKKPICRSSARCSRNSSNVIPYGALISAREPRIGTSSQRSSPPAKPAVNTSMVIRPNAR